MTIPEPPLQPGRTESWVDQAAVIEWLATPEAYDDGVTAVERIDTHSSVIFLAKHTVYKLKRAVKFDYLDYTALERRHQCCLDEVRLNRRTAPSLYRGVRAVTRASTGSFAIDGRGEPVDYLVEMTRFDPETQLDRLAARGRLDLGLMPALADAVAHLHQLAEWRFDQGGPEGMAAIIRGNRDGLQASGSGGLDRSVCGALTAESLELVAAQGPRLDARRLAGFVRHCHGDLHLRNACLVDGTPTLFDCVEFNDAIACVDVMYDLAFLLMDLLHRGLAAHANVVLNRYLAQMDDVEGLALLPLFLATRAAIRAKTSLTAIHMQTDPRESARLRDDARAYLDLAVKLVVPGSPQLVAVGGPSGSGKTTLARELAAAVGPAPGAIVLRSDLERKRLLGVSPETRLGPTGYTAGVTRDVYRSLSRRADAVLKSGHGAIIDAVCGDATDRAGFAEVARANQVSFTGLWLDAPVDTLTARVEARVGDASDATPEVAARQLAQQTPPRSWTVLDASASSTAVAREARRVVSGQTGRRSTTSPP